MAPARGRGKKTSATASSPNVSSQPSTAPTTPATPCTQKEKRTAAAKKAAETRRRNREAAAKKVVANEDGTAAEKAPGSVSSKKPSAAQVEPTTRISQPKKATGTASKRSQGLDLNTKVELGKVLQPPTFSFELAEKFFKVGVDEPSIIAALPDVQEHPEIITDEWASILSVSGSESFRFKLPMNYGFQPTNEIRKPDGSLLCS